MQRTQKFITTFVLFLIIATMLVSASAALSSHSGPNATFDESDADVIKLGNQFFEIGFSKTHGGISYILDKSSARPVSTGSLNGNLWAVTFNLTAQVVQSSTFTPDGANRFSYAWSASKRQLILQYETDPAIKKQMSVNVVVKVAGERSLELDLALQNHWGRATEIIAFPANLVFSTADVSDALLPVLPGIVLEQKYFTSRKNYLTAYPGYPGIFADYMDLSTGQSTFGMYSISDKAHLTPVAIGFNFSDCLNSSQVCYTHTFKAHAAKYTTWRSPRVRIFIGASRPEIINSFRNEDGLSAARSLPDKLGAELFQKLAQLPLYKADISQLGVRFANLPSLLAPIPLPGLFHLVGYGAGGFDRSYPDFIPPDARWGTTQELADLFTTLQSRGYLVMPYINPTWWDEKSPTLMHLPGELTSMSLTVLNQANQQINECYGCPANPHWGYVMSPYASFVQERLAELMQQITQEVPADLVFEDQIGARATLMDYNPASPLPEAYTQGWIDHTRTYTDDRLMTELGFDRLVAFRGQLHAIEYKDGAKPPSRRKLTANEANVAAQMGTRGVPVRVVCSTGEIIAVLLEG